MSGRGHEVGSPLEGVWVVDTRSVRQAHDLDRLLEEKKARPVSYPCIDIAPALDPTPLDEALNRAAEGMYDWLVFTSANAVEAVEARLVHMGMDPVRLAAAHLAAVGPGTAAIVADRLGLTVDLCPREYVAEALAGELLAAGARRVLVPQADRARDTLVRTLGERNGVWVEPVTAYRTVIGSGGADVPRLLRQGRVGAVVFASPSALENMATRMEQEGGDWSDLAKVCIACIGPVTAAAAEKRGLVVDVMPEEHTIPALVEGLERYFRERTGIRGRHDGRD